MSTDPVPLRERKRLRAASAIYDAAVALLASRPYAEVTVDEICEHAEVGRASFFRIYGTKNGLLAELARRQAEAIAGALAHSSAAGAAEKLAVVEQLISEGWTASEPGLREMAAEAFRAGMPDGGVDLHRGVIDLVAGLIAEGQRSGEFRTTTLPSDVLGWMLVVNLGVCVIDWLKAPGESDLRRRTQETLEILLAGLRKLA